MPASHLTHDVILTQEEVKEFYEKYEFTADVMQKTSGQIIYELIKKKGLTSKKKASVYGIDVNEVMELTGLNQNTIYLLNNPKRSKLTKGQIVSFSIGLGLNTTDTRLLLDVNGMVFNSRNIVDQAYTELIENHKGKSIADCNAILRDLGIDEKHFLGAHERNIT